MRNFDETLVWLGFFAAVFLAWYFYIQARNKERMALIESGKDVSEIYKKQEIKFRFPWLKLGLMVIGIGFGLGLFFTIYSLNADFFREVKRDLPEMFLAANMLVFGGIGLVVGYYLEKRKD
jgi:hypothetical protein